MVRMSSVRSVENSPVPPPVEDVVSLRNWPLRDDVPTSWLLLVAIGAVAVGVGMLSASPLAGAAAWFAMIVSLWRLWLPVRFEIGPRGLAQQVLGWRRLIVWRNIPRVEVRPQGIVFHASSNPSRFALLRSIYVRDGRHREQILRIVQTYAANGIRRGSSMIAR